MNIITQQSTNASPDEDSIEDEHLSNVPYYTSHPSKKTVTHPSVVLKRSLMFV